MLLRPTSPAARLAVVISQVGYCIVVGPVSQWHQMFEPLIDSRRLLSGLRQATTAT